MKEAGGAANVLDDDDDAAETTMELLRLRRAAVLKRAPGTCHNRQRLMKPARWADVS